MNANHTDYDQSEERELQTTYGSVLTELQKLMAVKCRTITVTETNNNIASYANSVRAVN